MKVVLQKIKYEMPNGRRKTVACGVNAVVHGGEYTFCGNVSFDEGDDWEIIGEQFVGKVKNITCGNCLKIINYIKSLE
jgi:hypothetical protein